MKKLNIVMTTILLLALGLGALAPIASMFQPVRVEAGNVFEDFDVSIDSSGGMNVKNESDNGNSSAWGTLIEKYKGFITGIAGVGAVTMVVLFIMQFLKLGAASGNPTARSQALVGVLWTGIAAAGLGAVSLIVGIFYGAI